MCNRYDIYFKNGTQHSLVADDFDYSQREEPVGWRILFLSAGATVADVCAAETLAIIRRDKE